VVLGRIQSLVTKTSEQASASLRFANAQVTALTTQTQGTPEGGGALSMPDRRTNRADARRGRCWRLDRSVRGARGASHDTTFTGLTDSLS
jgi:hypothetical protein